MNRTVLSLLLAFSSVLAFGSVLAASSANLQVGKVTRLMTKDLPDVPGKEGMMETVDFAPGEVSQPHRHNADLFVYVLEGSVITPICAIIRQIGQFVQHDVRFEVTNSLDKCLPIEDVTKNRFEPRRLSNSVLPGERVRPPITCPA